jgi:multiple sugar transport system permease protein
MREPRTTYAALDVGTKRLLVGGMVTLAATLLLLGYLSPLFYMAVTAFKSEQMIADFRAPLLPSRPATFQFEGEELDVYLVEVEGEMRPLALLQPGRQESVFVDPARPEAGSFTWEGNWRQLQPAYELAPQTENFPNAWRTMNFLVLLRNTVAKE